jgi:hypothetical protein
MKTEDWDGARQTGREELAIGLAIRSTDESARQRDYEENITRKRENSNARTNIGGAVLIMFGDRIWLRILIFDRRPDVSAISLLSLLSVIRFTRARITLT